MRCLSTNLDLLRGNLDLLRRGSARGPSSRSQLDLQLYDVIRCSESYPLADRVQELLDSTAGCASVLRSAYGARGGAHTDTA
jgi:hypothetical protein